MGCSPVPTRLGRIATVGLPAGTDTGLVKSDHLPNSGCYAEATIVAEFASEVHLRALPMAVTVALEIAAVPPYTVVFVTIPCRVVR